MFGVNKDAAHRHHSPSSMFNRIVESKACRATGLSEKKAKCLLYTACVLLLMMLLSPSQPASADGVMKGAMTNGEVHLSHLVGAAIALSNLAGAEIRKVKKEHKEETEIKGQTKEGVDEPVTVADANANAVFINGFRELFPGVTLVSEETEPAKKAVAAHYEPVKLKQDVTVPLKDLIVIVDPLDATKEFTEEYDDDGTWMLNYVTTLVCVVQNGEPIAGIVNRPFMEKEDVLWGIVPTKELNLVPKKAEGAAADKVTVSRSHAGDANDVVAKYFSPKTSLPAGGAGYKSWLVLTGAADAYIHTTKIKTWDLCAGHALVLASGGLVTDRSGSQLVYDKDNPAFKNGLVLSLTPEKTRSYVSKLSVDE